MLLLDIGDPLKGLLPRDEMGGRQVELAGQRIVDLQSDTKEWSLPPLVAWNEEREMVDEMRSILV